MALSRTPHGLLDMAAPALAALLWLGKIPPFHIILIGVITAFAGYTAVYALNDVVDFRTDRRKVLECGLKCAEGDLDAVYARHPMAQGLLKLREGILWAAAWGGIALLGAWLLNPACAVIFLLGCAAETLYCLMLRLSWTRAFLSGAVKSAGGIAAIYAVAPEAPAQFFIGFFLWFFFWEIGGQNVPNDWTDMEEDKRMGAKTIPVRFGPLWCGRIVFISLAISVAMSVMLFWLTPARLSSFYFAGAIPAGVFLLLLPAWRLLFTERTVESASALFNRASYYPGTMLVIIFLSALFK